MRTRSATEPFIRLPYQPTAISAHQFHGPGDAGMVSSCVAKNKLSSLRERSLDRKSASNFLNSNAWFDPAVQRRSDRLHLPEWLQIRRSARVMRRVQLDAARTVRSLEGTPEAGLRSFLRQRPHSSIVARSRRVAPSCAIVNAQDTAPAYPPA